MQTKEKKPAAASCLRDSAVHHHITPACLESSPLDWLSIATHSTTSYLNPLQQHQLVHEPNHLHGDFTISMSELTSWYPHVPLLFPSPLTPISILLALPSVTNQCLAASHEGWAGSPLARGPPNLVLCNSYELLTKVASKKYFLHVNLMMVKWNPLLNRGRGGMPPIKVWFRKCCISLLEGHQVMVSKSVLRQSCFVPIRSHCYRHISQI